MSELEQALDALVPERDEFGDWADVLRRAGVQRATPSAPSDRNRMRRGTLIALILAGVVLVPALVAAVLTRTNVIFSNAKPAPNVIKKQFLDLAFVGPSRHVLRPLAAQAREVGMFAYGGRTRRLWVAPTRGGGYCWQLERDLGGCLDNRSERRPLDVSYVAPNDAVTGVVGTVGARAVTVQVRYADGTTSDIPFVYVSAPIAAGFFAADLPSGHTSAKTRATRIAAFDHRGRVLGSQQFLYSRPPVFRRLPRSHGKYVPPRLPKAKVPPTEPAQRATADGFSVVAGANGSVAFKAIRLSPLQQRLLGKYASYGCFKVVREFGIFDTKGAYFSGRFVRSATIPLRGWLEHGWDGCEIQGGYGHLWPDRNYSHSLVEVPLSAKGRRFFADRATARDLALFLRSRNIRRIRAEQGATLARDLNRYRVTRLRSTSATPAVGRIGYVLTPTGVVFVEQSPTGHRFFVRLSNGKIKRGNLRPYSHAM